MLTNLSIYPNPSAGELFIELEGDEILTVKFSYELLDISGRSVLPGFSIESKTTQIDLKELKNGFYFIQLISGHQIVSNKKIVLLR